MKCLGEQSHISRLKIDRLIVKIFEKVHGPKKEEKEGEIWNLI